MINLYEIELLENEVEILLSNSEGEITFEIDMILQKISENKENKLELIAKLIKNIESETEAFSREISRLKDLREKSERKEENLKKLVSRLLPEGEKFKKGTHSMYYSKSESVFISDVDKILQNPQFVRTKTIVEPDKVAIKEALKNNLVIEGAILVSNSHLHVK